MDSAAKIGKNILALGESPVLYIYRKKSRDIQPGLLHQYAVLVDLKLPTLPPRLQLPHWPQLPHKENQNVGHTRDYTNFSRASTRKHALVRH